MCFVVLIENKDKCKGNVSELETVGKKLEIIGKLAVCGVVAR